MVAFARKARVTGVRRNGRDPAAPFQRRVGGGVGDVLKPGRRTVVKPVVEDLTRYLGRAFVPTVADLGRADAFDIELHVEGRHGLAGDNEDVPVDQA